MVKKMVNAQQITANPQYKALEGQILQNTKTAISDLIREKDIAVKKRNTLHAEVNAVLNQRIQFAKELSNNKNEIEKQKKIDNELKREKRTERPPQYHEALLKLEQEYNQGVRALNETKQASAAAQKEMATLNREFADLNSEIKILQDALKEVEETEAKISQTTEGRTLVRLWTDIRSKNQKALDLIKQEQALTQTEIRIRNTLQSIISNLKIDTGRVIATGASAENALVQERKKISRH